MGSKLLRIHKMTTRNFQRRIAAVGSELHCLVARPRVRQRSEPTLWPLVVSRKINIPTLQLGLLLSSLML